MVSWWWKSSEILSTESTLNVLPHTIFILATATRGQCSGSGNHLFDRFNRTFCTWVTLHSVSSCHIRLWGDGGNPLYDPFHTTYCTHHRLPLTTLVLAPLDGGVVVEILSCNWAKQSLLYPNNAECLAKKRQLLILKSLAWLDQRSNPQGSDSPISQNGRQAAILLIRPSGRNRLYDGINRSHVGDWKRDLCSNRIKHE